MRPGFFSLLAIASLVLACATSADACSVPVFRYALERWQPDLFQAIVVHRGALTSEQKKLVDAFDRSKGKNMKTPTFSTTQLLEGAFDMFARPLKIRVRRGLPWCDKSNVTLSAGVRQSSRNSARFGKSSQNNSVKY